MHPALMIAVMEEHERRMARATRHAWRQPTATPAPSSRRRTRHGRRLSAALARGLAFFS